MPRFTAIILLQLVAAGAAHAGSFTPEECATLASVYRLYPAECSAAPVSSAPQTTVQPVDIAAPDPTLPGTNGVLPSSPDALRVDNVFFPSGGAKLDEAAWVQLDALAQLFNSPQLSRACIGLIGHADNIGGAKANTRLSQARAEMVAEFLRPRLTFPGRIIFVEAAGSTRPLSAFNPSAPEQRRVSILVRDCESSDLPQG